MEYNINFCILSAAYLSVTAFFYSRQVHVKSRRSVLFRAMLRCGILSLAMDIAVALLDPYAYLWPAWAVYAANIVFLLLTQLSGVLFFYYTINLTGTYMRMARWLRALIMLPLAAAAMLILLSPFTRCGAFYLDANHIYRRGVTHIALYITMALYLLSGLCIVFVRRNKLQRLKFYTVLAFLLATLVAMLIQMNNPYLLVNSTANAFALMLMYYILEAPGAHVDALTGVMNRSVLLPRLRDVFEEGERCSLIIYTLNSLPVINHSFGMKGGDEVLEAFAAYLKKTYPKQSVIRTEGDIFSILLRGETYTDAESLARIRADIPLELPAGAGGVTLDVSLACINSEDCAAAEEMTGLLDRLMQRHRTEGLGDILLADAEFKAQLIKMDAVERAMKRALDEKRVEVYFQPIHNAEGGLCALEALVRVFDPELGLLPTQDMVELAEHNGSIVRLGEQVLEKTCAFIRDEGAADWGLDHIGVNLSAVQCAQSGLPERIAEILKQYGVPEGLVAFEVTETAAGALTEVRETMERLAARNIHFLLDDFGTGYANFKKMTALPYRCIKLDKSLLWDAPKSESRMRLLRGVVKIVHTLGLMSLCEGVETAEQAALLTSLGVSMLQGYYYSRPLPPETLVAYARKAGVAR